MFINEADDNNMKDYSLRKINPLEVKPHPFKAFRLHVK